MSKNIPTSELHTNGDITFESLTRQNIDKVRKIQRDDISTDFADDADTVMELTEYGLEHNCIGDTYAVKYKDEYIGLILLGEAIPWETDSPEMREEPFYRLMGFVMDKRYRGLGIGGFVLEKTIAACYEKYGIRAVALGCHKDNAKAAQFYLRHGFKRTEYMEGNDRYYLRYPESAVKKKKGLRNMSDWNSSQYLKFQKQRTQPSIDLAMRVSGNDPKSIADIGCGPGNSAAVLKGTFPKAHIIGIDSSPNMIEKARTEHPEIEFSVCDARSLEGKYDLLFSNACLQWIPDHDTLIPSLMEKLNEDGVLAVQIPMNQEEPFFRLIKEVTAEPKWGLADVDPQINKVLTPKEYFNILSGCSSSFEIWETKYYHPLSDHRALVEWVKSTALRPYLEHLSANQAEAFEKELEERSKELYPITDNGTVVLGFRRFFFTAVK